MKTSKAYRTMIESGDTRKGRLGRRLLSSEIAAVKEDEKRVQKGLSIQRVSEETP